jgi:hypothetical protein
MPANRIGIGTTNPNYNLDVVGNINYSGIIYRNGSPISISQVLTNVKDYGAVGNGIADDTAAIQSAIDAKGSVFVPAGTYKVSSTILLKNSYSAIIGDHNLPVIYKENPNTGPAIAITNVGSSINEFSKIQNLIVRAGIGTTTIQNYSSVPNINDCGIAINGGTPIGMGGTSSSPAIQRPNIENIRLNGWSTGIYCKNHVNTRIDKVFIENWVDQSSIVGYGTTSKFVGIAFDCTRSGNPLGAAISPNASAEVSYCIFGGAGTPVNVQSYGFYIDGEDPRDIYFSNCEVATVDYGWYYKSSTYGLNWNLQINRPIVDQCRKNGLYFYNTNIVGGSGPGAITINGGYIINSSGASASIHAENINGLSIVGGLQFISASNNGPNDVGVKLVNCYNSVVSGNNFLNCNNAIQLENSNISSVVGNTIYAQPTIFGSLNLQVGIGLTSSFGNIISGNSIRGQDISTKYASGIFISTDSSGNTIANNAIDFNTVTLPHNILNIDNPTNIFGRVGINTSFPSADLHVLGRIDSTTPNSGSTGGLRIRANPTSKTGYLQFTDSTGLYEFANVGITSTGVPSLGNAIYSGNLNVKGNITVDGGIIGSSGFISTTGTNPVKIQISGNKLIFSSVGIGSTSLTLS